MPSDCLLPLINELTEWVLIFSSEACACACEHVGGSGPDDELDNFERKNV